MYPDDRDLATAVENGHRWWVLKETTPEDVQLMISEYRNNDQNTSQVPV